MPLTLKPFVIIRRLIDSNSVNICHDYNALWGDYKKIKDKINGARYLPICKEKITNLCLKNI